MEPKNGGLVRIISFSLGVGEPAGLISQCVGIIRDQGTNPCCPLFNVREVDPNKMAWPREGRDVWRECITNRPYEFIKGIFMGMGLLPMKTAQLRKLKVPMIQWKFTIKKRRHAHVSSDPFTPVGWVIHRGWNPTQFYRDYKLSHWFRIPEPSPTLHGLFFMDFFVASFAPCFFGVEIMKII